MPTTFPRCPSSTTPPLGRHRAPAGRQGFRFREGKFHKGDAIVILHYAYGAVKESIHAYVSRAGAYVIEVDLPFPVQSDDQIIHEFRRALEKGKANGRRVCLSVIDHITSMPTVVIPVKELVRICREEGVEQVFVDAAHAIGNVDIDVKDIGADFYTSNLHKWFFCPPSVAFLYSKNSSKLSQDLHHPVVSNEYGNGLAIESAWIGTRDYSSQLVVPSVMEFLARFEGGIDGIRKNNHEAVLRMGQMLAHSWGTHLGTPPHMSSSMIMVALPQCLGIRSDKDAMKLRTYLRDKFGIEVPIYFKPPKEDGHDDPSEHGIGYARISHQVYNTVDDYHRFKGVINQLVGEGFVCESLPDN